MEKIVVNNKEFNVIKLLGKGKGGYSYLVERDGNLFCLKQIHHEPCDYYNFGNKLEAELRDYKTLENIGLVMPKLLEVDYEKEIILKEYIEGITIAEEKELSDVIIKEIQNIANKCKEHGINIDYYPTNFCLISNDVRQN